MKSAFFYCFLFIVSFSIYGQDIAYFLPQNTRFNPAIPQPKAVLGHEIGELHVTHDKLVFYMNVLKKSPRLKLDTIGYTHEKRPLIVLTFTSEKNLKRLPEILRLRKEYIENPALRVPDDMPAVAYMGYSIHGNEASGANAALAFAYYLAACESDELEKILDNVIVLLDPCFNPDGLQRFSTWVNMFYEKNASYDPADAQFNENFPFGRTNHYWFDLNRDWLPAVHPESQARLKIFHEYKPNVLTDHHEMGRNSTFFFQPGVPTRTNPLTPQKNQELTRKIGNYHAAAFDKIGSLYYSEENFDDFYYGKGSTFPDINGSVGILFEQASSRGHAQETAYGLLRFPFTIKNQITASFSSLQATYEMRKELLEWQKEFFSQAGEKARNDAQKALVFGGDQDEEKNLAFIRLLLRHKIEVFKLNEDLKTVKTDFKKNKAYLLPFEQTQYFLIKAMLQAEKKFTDSLFYDISAWSFAEAFRLRHDFLDGKNFKKSLLGEPVNEIELEKIKNSLAFCPKADYAYCFSWEQSGAAAMLHKLSENGFLLSVSQVPFEIGEQKFSRGTVVLPVASQSKSPEEIFTAMEKFAKEYSVRVTALQTGQKNAGSDLGSEKFKVFKPVKVFAFVGQNVNPNEIGEIRHFMNKNLDMPLSLIDEEKSALLDWNRYQVLILTSNAYQHLAGKKQQIADFVARGGTLIAAGEGIKFLQNIGLGDFKTKKTSKDSLQQRPYGMYENDRGAHNIGGVMLDARADLTHPLLFGIENEEIRVFRDNGIFLLPSTNPYATPLRLHKNPLFAGFLTEKNEKSLAETASVLVKAHGKGRMIAVADNFLFRGFWLGTAKIFANCTFFGQFIDAETAR
jgi:hypothetical protein